jgi:hypothetical protein
MAEIVNLRQARKNKARAEQEAKAAQNRVAFGRAKAEQQLAETEQKLNERRIEGHRLDGESPE